MTTRTMLLLGGGGGLLVAAVLGASLLFGGHGVTSVTGSPPTIEVNPVDSGVQTVVRVPPLAGVGYLTATDRLHARGLAVAAVVRLPSGRASGLVLRTYPEPGSELRRGGGVTLYISTH